MNKGGRPKDPIWNDFLAVHTEGKTTARCKHYSYELCSKVDRMKNHIRKCNPGVEVKVSR